MCNQILPGGDSSTFVDQIFRIFDKDNNGTIDFKEFMIATDTDKPIIQKNYPLPIKNTIYDKTFGSIVDRGDHKAFIAPVDGLYRFELQVQVYY